MSYIPDCRTDKYYNEKYLNDRDSLFLRGYDYAVEQMKNMCSNIEVFPPLMGIVHCRAEEETLEECIDMWAEMCRNEMITSMLDGMDEHEYEDIRRKVDGTEV